MRRRLALGVLLGAVLGALTPALETAFAEELAGGSRLVYFYSRRSFLSGAQAVGTGLTLFSVANAHPSAPVSIRFTIFNGPDCMTPGAVPLNLAARETRLLDVSSFLPASGFTYGVIDLWAVNGAGAPIRWDALEGRSIVVDLAGGVGAASVPAAKLFSDDRREPAVGSPVANESSPHTAAPLAVTSDVLPQGAGVVDTVFLFGPAVVPGAAPSGPFGPGAWQFSLIPSHGGNAQNAVGIPTACVPPITIPSAFTIAANGGRVVALGGPGKGVVGFKFTRVEVGDIDLLLGELMPALVSSTLNSAAQ